MIIMTFEWRFQSSGAYFLRGHIERIVLNYPFAELYLLSIYR